jgi:hypothetical protein
MAKTSSGALSTFIMDPSDAQYVQALREAQSNLRQALDTRSNQPFDPTLLAISQALGSPTKTGSFGEVIGNVAGAIGTSQQAEDKRAREIASMKMELAANELAQNRATQGMKAGFDLLNRGRPSAPAGQPAAPAAEGAPQAPAGQAAQPPVEGTAQPPAGLSGAPSNVTRNVTTNDIIGLKLLGNNTVADAIVKGIELDRGRYHVSNDMIVDKDAEGGPKVIADLRMSKQEPTEIVVGGKSLFLNMTGPELRDFNAAFAQGKGDEYYEKYLKGRKTDINLPPPGGALVNVEVPLLGDEFKLRVTPRQAAMIERYSEEALRTGNPTSLRTYVESLSKPMAMPAAPAATPTAPAAARPTAPSAAPVAPTDPSQPPMPAVTGRPPAPQPAAQPAAQPAPMSDLSRLPLADQEKVMMERITKSNAPAQETAAILQTTATPSSLNASDRRMRELDKLVAANPQVVGLMNKQGFLTALGTAANEGFRAGPYTVSLPVKEFMEKLVLDPKEQAIARRITMILDEEFFNRAALAKSALGPQISNADSILMKSPMARPEDAPQLIRYWALHGQMVNRQNDELYRAYNSWLDRTGGRAPARQFFDKEGRVIINKYTPFFEQLQDKFNAR